MITLECNFKNKDRRELQLHYRIKDENKYDTVSLWNRKHPINEQVMGYEEDVKIGYISEKYSADITMSAYDIGEFLKYIQFDKEPQRTEEGYPLYRIAIPEVRKVKISLASFEWERIYEGEFIIIHRSYSPKYGKPIYLVLNKSPIFVQPFLNTKENQEEYFYKKMTGNGIVALLCIEDSIEKDERNLFFDKYVPLVTVKPPYALGNLLASIATLGEYSLAISSLIIPLHPENASTDQTVATYYSYNYYFYHNVKNFFGNTILKDIDLLYETINLKGIPSLFFDIGNAYIHSAVELAFARFEEENKKAFDFSEHAKNIIKQIGFYNLYPDQSRDFLIEKQIEIMENIKQYLEALLKNNSIKSKSSKIRMRIENLKETRGKKAYLKIS